MSGLKIVCGVERGSAVGAPGWKQLGAGRPQVRKSEGTTPRKKIVFDDDDENPEQEATRELPATRGLKQVKAETGDENAENAHRRSK